MTGAATFCRRLRPGDHLRVIAPSRSLAVVSARVCEAAISNLQALGFEVSIGRRARNSGLFLSAATEDRLADLHEAFADSGVDGILSAVGGTRCSDILPGLDWNLIRRNPKLVCGHSDLTALLNTIWQQTSLVTYLGPHFSSFAMDGLQQHQVSAFMDAVATSVPVLIRQSPQWSDDAWYEGDAERDIRPAPGWARLQDGAAEANLIGGNFSTFLLLQGTRYGPTLAGSILLIEDVATVQAATLRRGLIALSLRPDFMELQGIIFGRFQRRSELDAASLREVLASLPGRYREIPILGDFDAGHTQPLATVPIGGRIRLKVGEICEVELLAH